MSLASHDLTLTAATPVTTTDTSSEIVHSSRMAMLHRHKVTGGSMWNPLLPFFKFRAVVLHRTSNAPQTLTSYHWAERLPRQL